jgi:large repetitive protein
MDVSTDVGTTFTTLVTYPGNTGAGTKTVSLAGYETSNTIIRFRLSTNFATNETVTIDNVVITAEPTSYASTFTEAVTYVSGSGGVQIADTDTIITDPSGGNLGGATIQIAGNYQMGADILEYTTTSGVTGVWNAATGTLTLSGAQNAGSYQNAIEAIRFNNSSNNPDTSPRTVTVVIRDTGGQSSNVARTTVNVTATNDAPTSTNDAVTTLEDTAKVLSLTDFGTFSDPDGTPASASSVRISTLPVAGALQYDSTGSGTWTAVTLSQVITATDINAGRLRFVPVADANGASYATVGFQVSDGTAFSASSYTLAVNVTAVNDAPVANADTAAVTEDSSVSVAILSGVIRGTGADTDVDDATNTLVVSGAVAGAGAVSQGVGVGTSLVGTYGTLTIATDGSYSYVANNANSLAAGATANDVFTYTVKDTGGAASNTATLTITVTGTNDAPVGTDTAVTTNEDTTHVFASANFGFGDVDTGDTLSAVRIDI